MTKHNLTEAVKATPGIVVLDATGVYGALHNSSSAAIAFDRDTKYRVVRTQGPCRIKQYATYLKWCHGDIKTADSMTKKKKGWPAESVSFLLHRDVCWCLTPSGNNRSQMGMNPLDDMSDVQNLFRKYFRDGIMTLFHKAGHEILTCAETARPPGT